MEVPHLPRTGSVSLESRGHKRFCSLAAFSTLLTVVLDALQLRAMFVWLRPNPDNRMISRYLVINGDLLCNAFTLQSAWIHYKGNRYHLTGISVSDDQNCGIHQNGFAVLRFRNSGSESPGILTRGFRSNPAPLSDGFVQKVLSHKRSLPKPADSFRPVSSSSTNRCCNTARLPSDLPCVLQSLQGKRLILG